MKSRRRVLVIGAGAAAHAAVETLLSADASLRVDVVGAEDRAPYNRTTINKGLLSGATTDEAIALASLSHPDLQWHLGREVVALNPNARQVGLDDGTELSGDAIVLATGSRPRGLPLPLPPALSDRVLTLRTPDDTARLRALASEGPVVVAGAGLIGNELPAELRSLTTSVSLVDPADRPLSRQVGPHVGAWITAEHHAAGTATHWRRVISSITPADPSDPAGRADPAARRAGRAPLLVVLDDGTEVDAAVVVACLGARPDTGWLHRAGITVHEPSGGLMVDTGQRVLGHPGLYAAGDLAAVPVPAGGRARIEHWGSAIQQGRTAADAVRVDLGLPKGQTVQGQSDRSQPADPPSPPTHSTYIGQTKLTFVGWPVPGRFREHVLSGELGRTRTLVVHTVNDRAVGAIGVGGARAVNAIRDHIQRAAPLEDIRDALNAA